MLPKHPLAGTWCRFIERPMLINNRAKPGAKKPAAKGGAEHEEEHAPAKKSAASKAGPKTAASKTGKAGVKGKG